MKNKISILLIALLVFSIIPYFPFSIPSIKAKESSISTIVSITPFCYLRETSDYIRIYNNLIGAEISKSNPIQVKYYTPSFDRVLIYMEQIFLERFNTKTNKWGQVANQIYQLSYKKIENGYDVLTNCSDTYSNLIFEIHHIIKPDQPLKLRADIKNVGNENQTIRIIWSLDGIVGNNEIIKGYNLTYGVNENNFDVKISYQDIINNFGNVVSISFSNSANGKKRDFTIGDFLLKNKTILSIDPSVVGTSTSSVATYGTWQRQMFYANGLFWVFFGNGTHILWKTSSDGITWSANNTLRAGSGDRFSLWFDGTYLYYVYADGNLYYRMGLPNPDGSITWSFAEVSITSSSATRPFICRDTNGYIWISYQAYDSALAGNTPYIIRSGNNDGTWGTTPSGFPLELSTTTGTWASEVIPLTNGKVLVLYAISGATIKARAWNGSAWLSEIATTSSISSESRFTAVAQGNIVHLVFLRASTYDIVYVKYDYSTNSFSAETTLKASQSSGDAPAICIDDTTNDLYVFWFYNDIIYLKKFNSKINSWETEGYIYKDTTSKNFLYDRIQAFYKVYNNKIGVAFSSYYSSGFYYVEFLYIKTNIGMGNFEAPSKVYANKYFYLNTTINDPNSILNFSYVLIQLNGSIILKWSNSTNTFSEYQDTNNYLTLDSANSLRIQINSTAYKLCFKIKLNWNYPEGYISILLANTKVYDALGLSYSNSYNSLFYFENDLIVYSLNVDDKRANTNQKITFSGVLYYEGTAIPPEDRSGITAKVELNGVLKNSTTTINADGSFSIPILTETTIGNYTYNVFSTTSKNSVQNKSISIVVDGINITQYVLDLKNEKLYVKTVYAFDNSPINNCSVSYNGLISYTNSSGIATFDISSVSAIPFNSIAYGVSEPKYNLNAKLKNQTIAFHKLVVNPFNIRSNNEIKNYSWNDVERKLSFETKGKCIVKTSNYGIPNTIEVDGKIYTNWKYDQVKQEVEIYDLSSYVVLNWKVEAPSGFSSGGITQPQPIELPKAEIPAPEKLINFGLFIIIAIIIGAIASQQLSKRKGVKKWRSRNYKSKVESKKWKKKEEEAKKSV